MHILHFYFVRQIYSDVTSTLSVESCSSPSSDIGFVFGLITDEYTFVYFGLVSWSVTLRMYISSSCVFSASPCSYIKEVDMASTEPSWLKENKVKEKNVKIQIWNAMLAGKHPKHIQTLTDVNLATRNFLFISQILFNWNCIVCFCDVRSLTKKDHLDVKTLTPQCPNDRNGCNVDLWSYLKVVDLILNQGHCVAFLRYTTAIFLVVSIKSVVKGSCFKVNHNLSW